MKLIKSELIQVVVTKERRTFEYFFNDERREFTLDAAPEFWEDEEMSLATVTNQIRWILRMEKGTDANASRNEPA